MNMKVHPEEQGSEPWLAGRAQRLNAGDAAAMLGCDVNGRTRTELLDAMVKGFTPEAGAFKQRLYDKGHQVEALTLPLAEGMVGESLYQIVGSIEVPGLQGRVGASFDGLTIGRDVAFECKSLNEALDAALPREDDPDANDASRLDKGYRVQMEQQLLVSGAEKVLFCAAAFHDSGATRSLRACWYRSDPALRAEILAGWKQLEADAATHVPALPAAPVVAQPVQALPAVAVQVSGSLVVIDNFKVFENAMRDFLEHRLIRAPKSDQDFADLEVQIKAMKGAEAALDAAEGQMLAQIQSVDEAKKNKDMLLKLVRDNRLMAEKLLTAEKDRRKGEIVMAGAIALREHVVKLNERIGKPYMPPVSGDFAGAIRGLKSLASMEDKVATELSRAKIAANECADRIELNLRYLREHAEDHKALFPDVATIVLKAGDDLQALVTSRIAQHKAAEEKRLEAERDRIRQEEAAKLRAEQEEADREKARQAAEAAKPAATPAPAPIAAPAVSSKAPAANSPVVVPIRRTSPDEPPMRLGQIGERLGFALTADFLAQLGFQPVATEKAAKLYRAEDFYLICEALVAHVRTAQHKELEAA